VSEILRTCVCCRQQKDKREMTRIVKDKTGKVFVDPSHKANGRGAYVCNNKDCIQKAIKSNIVANQLKCQISKEEIERMLTVGE